MTLSSTESEYVAATNAGKEGHRLRFLLAEFKLLDAGKPTILRVDNKSAITVAAGLGLTGNLKHMERRYAWLQHMVRRGKFELKYIPTTEQPADFLTKALHFPDFKRCSIAIGQRERGRGVLTGVKSWPRPRLGNADDLVGCTGVAADHHSERAARQASSGCRGPCCGAAVDQGARQLQLIDLGDGWAVDQEALFDREADGAVRRPEK
ncbi:unnamed protein product [Closterium sp. NIES-53]